MIVTSQILSFVFLTLAFFSRRPHFGDDLRGPDAQMRTSSTGVLQKTESAFA